MAKHERTSKSWLEQPLKSCRLRGVWCVLASKLCGGRFACLRALWFAGLCRRNGACTASGKARCPLAVATEHRHPLCCACMCWGLLSLPLCVRVACAGHRRGLALGPQQDRAHAQPAGRGSGKLPPGVRAWLWLRLWLCAWL